MRVDGLSNLRAAIRTNIADLMGRLETGDVIKAKVLEITSGEVLLRLFDGSILKAEAGEDLQAKVGQTLSLTVTSKSEGTLFLETLKDQSQIDVIKPDLLKSMLASLNIKTNTQNLELAAEFVKAGISPNAEQFEKTSELMKDFKGLNPEKAVFMTSKGIQGDRSQLELLSKLLDGELKLGEQLKSLHSTLESVAKTVGKIAGANNMLNAFLDAAASVLAEKASAASGTPVQKNSITDFSGSATASKQQLQISSNSPNSSIIGSSLPEGVDKSTRAGNTDLLSGNSTANGINTRYNSDGVNTAQQNSSFKAGTGSVSTTLNTSNSEQNETSVSSNASTSDNKSVPQNNAELDGVLIRGTEVTAEKFTNKAGRMANILDNTADNLFRNNPTADPLSKLKDAIKDLFIRLDSDKSASGTEVSKLHRELADKLDMIRSSIQSSGLAGLPGGEGITAATNLLDDSVRLMNQLNNNSVLYYQLPINLSGQNTTAELFIMKREQNKKRIDPHNSVLFISLDTNHLGRFETLIDVKGNNVTLNFRTEKKEINDFVKENIKYLYSGLSESGYKLADIRYALIDSATPPVKLEQLLSKMIESNRSKVDMRI